MGARARGMGARRRAAPTRASASSTGCATTRPATRSRASTGARPPSAAGSRPRRCGRPTGSGRSVLLLLDGAVAGGEDLETTVSATAALARHLAGRGEPVALVHTGRAARCAWPGPGRLAGHRGGPRALRARVATGLLALALRAEATAPEAPELIVVLTCAADPALVGAAAQARAIGVGVAAVLVGPAAAPRASWTARASRWSWSPPPTGGGGAGRCHGAGPCRPLGRARRARPRPPPWRGGARGGVDAPVPGRRRVAHRGRSALVGALPATAALCPGGARWRPRPPRSPRSSSCSPWRCGCRRGTCWPGRAGLGGGPRHPAGRPGAGLLGGPARHALGASGLRGAPRRRARGAGRGRGVADRRPAPPGGRAAGRGRRPRLLLDGRAARVAGASPAALALAGFVARARARRLAGRGEPRGRAARGRAPWPSGRWPCWWPPASARGPAKAGEPWWGGRTGSWGRRRPPRAGGWTCARPTASWTGPPRRGWPSRCRPTRRARCGR